MNNDHTYVFKAEQNAIRFIMELRNNFIAADGPFKSLDGKTYTVDVMSEATVIADMLRKYDGTEQPHP
jgi:hypothetical protein